MRTERKGQTFLDTCVLPEIPVQASDGNSSKAQETRPGEGGGRARQLKATLSLISVSARGPVFGVNIKF